MKKQAARAMKKVARYYYEELNYQVSVKGKVRFCDVDVLVSFEIVSPPPAALVLINFFQWDYDSLISSETNGDWHGRNKKSWWDDGAPRDDATYSITNLYKDQQLHPTPTKCSACQY